MKQLLLFLFCLAQPLLAVAQIDISRIEIILPAENTTNRELAAEIQRTLRKSSLDLDIQVWSKDAYRAQHGQSTLVIAIGDSLLPWLTANKDSYAGAIAFLPSSAAFLEEEKSNKKLTAIFRDQPLLRQLHLAKLLIPNLHSVAIIRGNRDLPKSSADLQRLSSLTVTETIIDVKSEWARQLSQLMQSHDLLLGIDDQNIYNAGTIRSILLTSYRHGKGLIGPSRAFVNAGSLASCYTSTEQHLQQLAEMVRTIAREHRLPRAQYPHSFHVAINKQVATSLNILIQDENTLSARLQDQKGECGDGC